MKDPTWYAARMKLGQRYVSAAVNTVAAMSPDENALAGFRWSLTLVAKCLGVPREWWEATHETTWSCQIGLVSPLFWREI